MFKTDEDEKEFVRLLQVIEGKQFISYPNFDTDHSNTAPLTSALLLLVSEPFHFGNVETVDIGSPFCVSVGFSVVFRARDMFPAPMAQMSFGEE